MAYSSKLPFPNQSLDGLRSETDTQQRFSIKRCYYVRYAFLVLP